MRRLGRLLRNEFRSRFVAGWWLSLFSLIGACAFEEDRELGWYWASSVLFVYFTLVLGLGKWWRVVRATAQESAPAPSPAHAQNPRSDP